MGAPSAFDISRAIGERIGNVQRRRSDLSAIDEILGAASQAQSPEDIQASVTEVLKRVSPERQQQVLAVLGARQQQRQQQQQRQKESEFYQSLDLDPRLAYVPDSVKKEFLKKTNEDDLVSSEMLEKTLIDAGYDPQYVKQVKGLYDSATTGGKTKILDRHFELDRRGLAPKVGQDIQPNVPGIQENIDFDAEIDVDRSAINPEFSYPKVENKPGPGQTFAEWDKQRAKNQGQLVDISQKNTEALKNSKAMGRIYARMEQINESGRLPGKLASTLVVSDEGQLRPKVGRFLSREAQEYAKLVNQLTAGARSDYGARLTNFELKTFIQRLPSLSNSEAGRRAILKALQLQNNIELAHQQALDEVSKKYNKGQLNPIEVQNLADKIAFPLVEDYVNEYGQWEEKLDLIDDAPRGTVALLDLNDEVIYVPKKEVDQVRAQLKRDRLRR